MDEQFWKQVWLEALVGNGGPAVRSSLEIWVLPDTDIDERQVLFVDAHESCLALSPPDGPAQRY